MEQIAIVLGVFCVAPMGLISFGYWIGIGMPGSPFVITRRKPTGATAQRASVPTRVDASYVE